MDNLQISYLLDLLRKPGNYLVQIILQTHQPLSAPALLYIKSTKSSKFQAITL